jgi:DNA polymerase-3 subunit gamma/tau
MEVVSMVSHLGTIATAEGIEIDEAALVAIARKADGSMRDSQSIFDQVVAFCGNSIRLADVADALHLIDADFFFEISTAARERNVARMFELARQVVTRGYDLQECLVGLLEHYRNLLTVIATGSAELIEGAEATRERYVQESALVGQTDVIRNMAAISQGEAQLRQNPPQPRVRFEFTLVRLASMDSSVDLGELLARLGAGGGAQPVGGVPVAIRVGPLRPRKEPASPKPPAIPQSVDKELKPVGELSRKIRAMPRSVNSLTQREMALKWPDVLSELPEHLAFVRSTVRQGLLGVDFTEVGLLLRPSAEIIAHRLSDKLADLKEHLSKVYAAPVAVQLLAAPENGERRAENRERRAENGERRAENGERGAENGEQRTGGDYVPLPIEETLVRLFHARRAGA